MVSARKVMLAGALAFAALWAGSNFNRSRTRANLKPSSGAAAQVCSSAGSPWPKKPFPAGLDNQKWNEALPGAFKGPYSQIGHWDPGYIGHLLKKYYPGGTAWPIKISEAEVGLQLNDEEGNQVVEGIAVDVEGDGKPELFLYANQFQRQGIRTLPDLKPAAFPFRGRMLPDSYGKITSVMMTADRVNAEVIVQLFNLRPEIKFQILYPAPEEMPKNRTAIEEQYLRQFGRFLPEPLAEYELSRPKLARAVDASFHPYRRKGCDWPPCDGELWIQDQFYVGVNEFGETFAAGSYSDEITKFSLPLVRHLGATAMHTWQWVTGGNFLASSRHLFLPRDRYGDPITPEDSFRQTFANGLGVVEIDTADLPATDFDLDEFITPTEEVRDGKPVVIVADAGFSSRKLALDGIARALGRSFFVERIPIVLTFNGEYSYNNVLMENYRENGRCVKRVYMPWYQGREGTNQEAAEVYRKYGYEVVPIGALEEAGGQLSGTLRCMTKVTQRQF